MVCFGGLLVVAIFKKCSVQVYEGSRVDLSVKLKMNIEIPALKK